MPRVPTENTPDATIGGGFESQGSFTPEQQINSSPNAFGSAVYGQLEAVGQMQNKLSAMDADLAFSKEYAGIESNYLSTEGSNAVKGLPTAMDAVNDLRDKYIDTAENPMQQALIAETLNKRVGVAASVFGSHAGEQNKKWMDNTLVATQQNEITEGTDDYASPQMVAARVDKLSALTDTRGQALGWSDQTTQMQKADVVGQYVSGMIRRAADSNPDTAAAIYKAYQPLMDAKHQADMGVYIDNRRYTDMMRAYTQEAKEQAEAKRNLDAIQSNNEANHLADVVSGKPLDTGTLVDQLRSQQISTAGFNAIMTRRTEGTTDPVALVKLQAGIGDGTVTQDEIYAGMSAGLIGPKDGLEATKALNEVKKSGDNQVERGYFKQLQTALGADAIEKGMVDFSDEAKRSQVALWAQAQGEWNSRVLVGKENPQAVVQDMLPRYQKSVPDIAKAWPNPKFGAISKPEDLPEVWQKTQAAKDAGQISDATYDQEAALIKKYKDYYADLQTRQQAAQSVAPSTGGSRVIGLSTGSQ